MHHMIHQCWRLNILFLILLEVSFVGHGHFEISNEKKTRMNDFKKRSQANKEFKTSYKSPPSPRPPSLPLPPSSSSSSSSSSSRSSRLTYFTLISIVKGGEDLVQWLYYHYLLGIHKIFLVSNDCNMEDYAKLILDIKNAPIPNSFVHIIKDFRCFAKFNQAWAYSYVSDCIFASWRNGNEITNKNLLIRTAFIDGDEFIVTKNGQTIHQIFKTIIQNQSISETTPQWNLLWKTFGTSFLFKRPENGTIFSDFIMRVQDCDHPIDYQKPFSNHPIPYFRSIRYCNRRFHSTSTSTSQNSLYVAEPFLEKSMCNLDLLHQKFGSGYIGNTPHFCLSSKDFTIHMWSDAEIINPNLIWINHYVTKSKQEWFYKITTRGRLHSNDFQFNNMNHHNDSVTQPNDLKEIYNERIDLAIIESIISLCSNIKNNLIPLKERSMLTKKYLVKNNQLLDLSEISLSQEPVTVINQYFYELRSGLLKQYSDLLVKIIPSSTSTSNDTISKLRHFDHFDLKQNLKYIQLKNFLFSESISFLIIDQNNILKKNENDIEEEVGMIKISKLQLMNWYVRVSNSNLSNHCCMNLLLGSQGISEEYSSQTLTQLKQYCQTSSSSESQHPYKKACAYLLTKSQPYKNSGFCSYILKQLSKLTKVYNSNFMPYSKEHVINLQTQQNEQEEEKSISSSSSRRKKTSTCGAFLNRIKESGIELSKQHHHSSIRKKIKPESMIKLEKQSQNIFFKAKSG